MLYLLFIVSNSENFFVGTSLIELQRNIESSQCGCVFFGRSVCYKGWQSFCSLFEDWMKFAKKWRKPLKKRDVPRPKRLQRALEEIHNILDGINQDKVRNMSRTLVNQDKLSKSLQFGTGEATTYTSVNSSCQDFPSWKRPVPAYLPGFQCPIQSQPSLLLSAIPNQNVASPRR